MEILDVQSVNTTVDVKAPISIAFKIIGAENIGFFFPLSNESLTEPKIQFVHEEGG